MSHQLFLTLSGKSPYKIEIHSFFEKLFKLFPNKPFQIYDSSGYGRGPFRFYPKYYDWSEYKKGEKLGRDFRTKKISLKRVLQRLKKWKKLPRQKNKELYTKFLIISGFNEGWADYNTDIVSATSWKKIKKRIDESFKLAINDFLTSGGDV